MNDSVPERPREYREKVAKLLMALGPKDFQEVEQIILVKIESMTAQVWHVVGIFQNLLADSATMQDIKKLNAEWELAQKELREARERFSREAFESEQGI